MNKNITLHINTGCNLHCSYCVQNTQQPEISEEKMFNQLPLLLYILKNINKPDSITLVGGEPGLWSYKLFTSILETIDSVFPKIKIIVDTNGFFIKKFPFTLNDPRFGFFYHIANPESYDLLNDPYIKLPNVYTTIVVTKQIQNNSKLISLYKKECNAITYSPCRIYENDKLKSLVAYNENLESCFDNKRKINNNSLFEEDFCYNKIFEFIDQQVYYYSCCRCCYKERLEITKNTNFTNINKELLSMNFIKTYCKNCQILLDNFVLK